MIDLLTLTRLTALPALLFLLCLPVFLLLPARYSRSMFLLGSMGAICVVAGPVLGIGLLLINVGGYVVVECVARLPRWRRGGFVLGLLLLQAAYWACFALPVPPPFSTAGVGPSGAQAFFVLFSGIGLTFFRLITYFRARVRNQPALSLPDYLTYALYYPQFRHGPIERVQSFTARLRAARQNWSLDHLRAGLVRIAIGLAELALVRMLFAAWVHGVKAQFGRDLFVVFDRPDELSAGQLLLLIHMPAVLVYLLESSYAHMQLGVSRMFGVAGSENFRQPFLARDPQEFWQRWNITLSRWLRDYVYVSLMRGWRHKHVNVVLVFVYCGLLHGLRWQCVCWGLWTGCTMAVYLWLRDRLAVRSKRGQALRETPFSGRPEAVGSEPVPVCTGPPGPTPRLTGVLDRHPSLRVVIDSARRLLTVHWFCLGVTIMVDTQHCGGRVLWQYLKLLGQVLTGAW